ncbi:hypothetical protein L208DRAFT_1302119, partial [Tricholoma matsutake]
DVIVQLPEKSLILDMLFQFCHSDPHSELNDLAFDTLTELAEAAENYKVFSAISVCKISMKCFPKHAVDILAYAACHDHRDILDMVAPLVVKKEILSETLPKLPPDTVLCLVRKK